MWWDDNQIAEFKQRMGVKGVTVGKFSRGGTLFRPTMLISKYTNITREQLEREMLKYEFELEQRSEV